MSQRRRLPGLGPRALGPGDRRRATSGAATADWGWGWGWGGVVALLLSCSSAPTAAPASTGPKPGASAASAAPTHSASGASPARPGPEASAGAQHAAPESTGAADGVPSLDPDGFGAPFTPGIVERHAPPAEAAIETEHLAREYAPLSPLKAWPAGLDPKPLLATLAPRLGDRGSLAEILAERPHDLVVGAQRFGHDLLVHASDGVLLHSLVLLDPTGRVLDHERFELRTLVYLRDLVDDATPEIVVETIRGTAMATYPRQWTILQLRARSLQPMVSNVPKEHSAGSKYLEWTFLNHFEFHRPDELTVTTVLSTFGDCDEPCAPGAEPWQPRRGEKRVYRRNRSNGRFVLAR